MPVIPFLVATSIFARLLAGGITVYIQLALSVVALAYILERLVNLRAETIVPRGLAEKADELWRAGKFGELRALCAKKRSVLSSILLFIVDHRDNSFSDVSRVSNDIGSRLMKRHMQKCYPIAVVAALEPLLGLLGTVIGMMETFEVVAQSGALGNASLLAGGISKFLICTGVGLFIAVPCLMFYHYFRGRTHRLANELEHQVSDLLAGWFMKRSSGDEH